MWNRENKNILVFLTERCTERREALHQLKQQLAHAAPSFEGLVEMVDRLSTIREQLPRCEALRDRFSVARFEKKSLADVMKAEFDSIDEDSQKYVLMSSSGNLTHAHLAGVAVRALAALRDDLEQFSDVEPLES